MGDRKMELPPGLQFDPTDEELIVYFLSERDKGFPCNLNVIPDLDFYGSDPRELTDKAYQSKRDCYFFSKMKQHRSTRRGFWKELGFDQMVIYTSDGNEIGIKNYLVYCGHDDEDETTNSWIMEEYHLLNGNAQTQDVDEWILCRVHEEENDWYPSDNDAVELSSVDEIFLAMDCEEDDDEEINSASRLN